VHLRALKRPGGFCHRAEKDFYKTLVVRASKDNVDISYSLCDHLIDAWLQFEKEVSENFGKPSLLGTMNQFPKRFSGPTNHVKRDLFAGV
jgi:hypothetical protein